jgi:hypothetical protein
VLPRLVDQRARDEPRRDGHTGARKRVEPEVVAGGDDHEQHHAGVERAEQPDGRPP